MNRPAMDVGEGVAALHLYLAAAQTHDHDLQTALKFIPQHPQAIAGSLVDDAWLIALDQEGER